MKSFSTLFTLTIMLFTVACGGGGKNSTEAKQKELAELKKSALELNVKIVALEQELEKLGGGASEKTVLVAIDTVSTKVFTHYIELQGKIESESVSFVTPRAGGGQVKALYIKRGDNVRKGQLILQLDNSLIKQSAAAAAQNIETLKAQAALAKSVYERQKNLWAQNIGSEIQLMTAKTNADALSSQLKAATQQLGMVNDQLAFTSVYSDVDGVAEEVNVKVGDLFAGPGQIKIVNTAKLKVTAQVPENYAGRVKVGTDLKLYFPDLNKTTDNKVLVIGKVIDPLSRSFFIETKLANGDGFKPNQMAQVRIKDYEKTDAIIIPLNILQNDEQGKFIYIASVEKGKLVARKKSVEIGEFYENNVEIHAGINKGDIIITEGYQSLYDGQFIATK